MPIVHCDVRSVEDRVAVHSFDCISATTPRLLLQQAISRPRSRRQTASRPSRSANPSAGTSGLTVVHCNLRSASSLNARTSGILVFIAAIQIDFAAPSKAYSFCDASRIGSPQNCFFTIKVPSAPRWLGRCNLSGSPPVPRPITSLLQDPR